MTEIMLVVAMIGIISIFSLNLSSGFLWRTDLTQATQITVNSLRQAQVLSQAQINDSGWGVHIENNLLTIFAGDDFNSRNSEFDEEYELGSVTSATTDVIYNKGSGLPEQASTQINLLSIGEIATIDINREGNIDY